MKTVAVIITEDEAELISEFRAMNADAQSRFLEIINGLVGTKDAKAQMLSIAKDFVKKYPAWTHPQAKHMTKKFTSVC